MSIFSASVPLFPPNYLLSFERRRGDAAAPPVLIPSGVTLAGVPVGGMSNEQAQAALRPAFARPVRLVYGDRAWRLVPSRFGAKVTIARGVADALRAQPGTAVQLVPTVDDRAVRKFVGAIDRRISYPAKDAELTGLKDLVPQFSQDDPGLRVLRALTAQRIVRALQTPRITRIRVATQVRPLGVAPGQSVYPTPLGTFSIVDMQLNPWWRPPDSPWAKGLKPIPPGPGHPLGTRWMGLSAPGVGIHGTPDDASIGYSASHGCIRMHIPDAEWLFEHVHLGTPVVITDA